MLQVQAGKCRLKSGTVQQHWHCCAYLAVQRCSANPAEGLCKSQAGQQWRTGWGRSQPLHNDCIEYYGKQPKGFRLAAGAGNRAGVGGASANRGIVSVVVVAAAARAASLPPRRGPWASRPSGEASLSCAARRRRPIVVNQSQNPSQEADARALLVR